MGTIPGKYAVEVAHLVEVEAQSKWALRAFDELVLGAEQYTKDLVADDVLGPFFGSPLALHYAVPSFLIYAKTVADFFFEGKRAEGRKPKPLVKIRCERLRELTGVSEKNHPALSKLSLRNYLVHIDEKIDEVMFYNWDMRRIEFHSMHVSPPDIKLGRNQYAVRLFDAERLVVRVLDRELKLEPVKRDVEHVKALAREGMGKLTTFTDTPLYELYQRAEKKAPPAHQATPGGKARQRPSP